MHLPKQRSIDALWYSFLRVRKNGAGKEARTPDPNLGKVVLYQLSYSRISHESDMTLNQDRCFAIRQLANILLKKVLANQRDGVKMQRT